MDFGKLKELKDELIKLKKEKLPWKGLKKAQPMVLGIDIGTLAIKLVELSSKDGMLTLETYAIETLPPDVVVEKEIKDVEQVGQAIARAYEKSRASIKTVAVALPSVSSITKLIEISKHLNEADIFQQVSLDADRYIPYPREEVSLDFEVIGPSQKNTEMLDVLLVATRSEHVDIRVDAVAVAGLQTRVVDLESYALERGFNFEKKPSTSEGITEALIDLGATNLSLVVLHSGKMIYTREQAFGGKKLIEEIQFRYGFSYDEAVRWYKFEHLPEDIEAEILSPFREAVVQQIQRALQLFYSSTEFRSVDHLYLAGGLSMVSLIVEDLQKDLGIKVSRANPFAGIQVSSKINQQALATDASSLLVAFGLALRSFTHA